MRAKIAIIDDEVKLLKALKRALEIEGHEVFDFSAPESALEFILKRELDLVISDIRMSGLSGIELLGRIKRNKPDLPCILMTAFSSVDTAVTAVKLGARDYLLKPFELADFKVAVNKALDHEKKVLLTTTGKRPIVGNSEPMKEVHKLIEKVAETSSTILITGESGTGKELVARAIHDHSPRHDKEFVAVNCSAIPEQLFESEMFGHKKGSFTNAYIDKTGLFKEAESGTLFLDEVGDLPVSCQAKLLRVLQDGTYKPIGSNNTLQADVRIVAATNKNLQREVQSGNFREDLLYRINVVDIALPPLRKRKEDIAELVQFFIRTYAARHGREISGATPEFFATLANYDWPGNIRQLENAVERAVILKRSGELTTSDLNLPDQNCPHNEIQAFDHDDSVPLAETINRIEEQIILQTLETSNWNYSKAASALGVTRQNLHYKLKKYGIKKEE